MQLPEKLLASLEEAKGFNKEAFEKIHTSGEQVTSIRLNPEKPISRLPNFPILQSAKIPWTDYGFYLDSRPSFTFDPLFHAGCYYVQEASSMFLEQALKQTVAFAKPIKILDLAAAPGGKSTHIQSLISKDSLLVSNEVIRARVNILRDNIIKWGSENVVVTNNDPKDFARLENYFDVIVVDAPCSGSGLFRREEEAISEWSLNNVQLCSQRQQRILADVWPALKKSGILIYSTCSYSREEDEEIVDWMKKQFAVEYLPLKIDPGWNITETNTGFRFWPDKIKGEGFFISCLQKKEGSINITGRSKNVLQFLTKKEKTIVSEWMRENDIELVKRNEKVFATPGQLIDDINVLLSHFRVIYFGTELGELIREKFIPAHGFALSHLISDKIPRIELEKTEAIAYLQKKELKLDNVDKGWQLVTWKHHPLGWVNVLANRINNYYPKELRILKDKDASTSNRE